MPIEGTHHVAIICSDYARSKNFYTEILGFEVINELYREERQSYKLDLRMPDGTRIELFSFPSPPPRPSYPESCGLRHLALKVTNLDREVAILRERGVILEEVRVDAVTGKRFVFFADPDGLPLELYEEAPSVLKAGQTSFRLVDFIASSEQLLPQESKELPWQILPRLSEILMKILESKDCGLAASDSIFIDPSAIVEEGAIIKGPAFISANCYVAAGAYLRNGVFLGERVSIGPSCEVKSSLIFENSALAHFNFVGDSILGSNVNFEAGSHTANHWNEREDKTILVSSEQGMVSTGLKKFGAVVGDDSRIGANAVLSPGTLLKPKSIVPRLALVDQSYCPNPIR